jgi:hypothetical protein
MPAFGHGNDAALKHGATAERQIRPRAASQKRRFLRQIGARRSDLDGVGLALLDNWARAQAKVELLDAWFDAHGLIGPEGEPRAPLKVYFTALNSARLAATRLAEHLRERVDPAPLALLEGEGRRIRLEAEQRLREAG